MVSPGPSTTDTYHPLVIIIHMFPIASNELLTAPRSTWKLSTSQPHTLFVWRRLLLSSPQSSLRFVLNVHEYQDIRVAELVRRCARLPIRIFITAFLRFLCLPLAFAIHSSLPQHDITPKVDLQLFDKRLKPRCLRIACAPSLHELQPVSSSVTTPTATYA